MRKLLRKLFGGTDKIAHQKAREEYEKAVQANYEASSQIIRECRETRKVKPVPMRKYPGVGPV